MNLIFHTIRYNPIYSNKSISKICSEEFNNCFCSIDRNRQRTERMIRKKKVKIKIIYLHHSRNFRLLNTYIKDLLVIFFLCWKVEI